MRDRHQAAVSSVRYRYRVARLTPTYFAMSLPVCPSAFIRFAVGDVLGVIDLPRPPELGAVVPGGFPLERGALLAG
jgi:hypothetical protein